MQSSRSSPALAPAERIQKRKLVVRDAVALLTLLAVTLALGAATAFLFRSFSDLRARLAQRWLSRGEAALHGGHPEAAVEDLRSALAYSPGQRGIEVELAEALAGAGRIQEAISYFNTLWEVEPGSGIINLQLARLAVRQKDQENALQHYRAAIYGTWEGDGTVRRREVRLELIDYLLGMHRFNQARSELLIASGNAPDDPDLKLQIAALMEKAGDPASAGEIYKNILQHAPRSLTALSGAARTAFALDNFVQARDFAARALAAPTEGSESAQTRQDLRDLRDRSIETLLYYPSPALSSRAQAERVLRDRALVFDRLHSCGVPLPGQPSLTLPGEPQTQIVAPPIAEVLAKWAALPDPSKLTVPRLQRDEELRQTVIQLVYATEIAADKSCGPATGENAMLARIAANPGAVEAE
jgi:tetratricopeptide (TPR) repeat protein